MTDHAPPWMSVRWYAVVNDLIGGWSVACVDKPCSAINPGTRENPTGEWMVAEFMDRKTAEYVARLHNLRLSA